MWLYIPLTQKVSYFLISTCITDEYFMGILLLKGKTPTLQIIYTIEKMHFVRILYQSGFPKHIKTLCSRHKLLTGCTAFCPIPRFQQAFGRLFPFASSEHLVLSNLFPFTAPSCFFFHSGKTALVSQPWVAAATSSHMFLFLALFQLVLVGAEQWARAKTCLKLKI